MSAKHYTVKEIFSTLQGEGFWSGRAAVFLRMTGCNLWSGREEDRGKGAGGCSAWCDTSFVGGVKLSAAEITEQAASAWLEHGVRDAGVQPFLVLTGGEPSLQADNDLLWALHGPAGRFYVAMETNGTKVPPTTVNWVTLSPKSGAAVVVHRADELKFVYPQVGLSPLDFVGNGWDFEHYFIQPKDDANKVENTKHAIEFVRRHPKFRLSVQAHKIWGVR